MSERASDDVIRERVRGLTRPEGPVEPVGGAGELGEPAEEPVGVRVLPRDLGGEVTSAVEVRGTGLARSMDGKPELPAGKGKAKDRSTKEQWGKLVEAYREVPGGHQNAAKVAGVSRRTARRAWEEGFSWAPWGMVPIEKMMEAEQRDARALVQKKYTHETAKRLQEEIERDQLAKQHSVEARADEGILLQLGRKTAGQVLGVVGAMTPGLRLLAQRMNEALMVHMAEGKVMTMGELQEALKLVEKSAIVIRNLAGATESLIEAERMYLGEAVRKVELTMSAEQAMKELERARDWLEPGREDNIIDITNHRFLTDAEKDEEAAKARG